MDIPQTADLTACATSEAQQGCVHFVGIGPGDPELLTIKARRLIEQADLVLYTESLANPAILCTRPGALVQSSTCMPLDDQITLMRRVVERGGSVARLHTGDPSIFGAISEQMRALAAEGVAYEVVPGVSSAMAAAAALGIELTIPEVTQTVVFSRVSGKTVVPSTESLSALAPLRCSLVLFLSAGMLPRISQELTSAGYAAETPVAVVYRASWPDQRIIRGTLEDIALRVEQAEITRQAVVIVSPALCRDAVATARASHLYGTALEPPARQDRAALITLTRPGMAVGRRLLERMQDAHLYAPRRFLADAEGAPDDRTIPFDVSIRQVLQLAFAEYRALVCIMASGIVVRELASVLRNKHTDPAVVVVDPSGQYAISLLSGHKGGGNGLACRVAHLLGGQPVLTTASDTQNLPALDLIGQDEGWVLGGGSDLTAVIAALVNGEKVGVFQESGDTCWWPDPSPAHLQRYESAKSLAAAGLEATLLITHHAVPADLLAALPAAAIYHPRVLTVGVGCNRGTQADEIEAAVVRTLDEAGLAVESISCVATADAKADEEGLCTACTRRGWRLCTYTAEQINSVDPLPNPSAWAEKALGVRGVCEPAAALAAGTREWLVQKQKLGNVTVAVCVRGAGSAHGEEASRCAAQQ